MIAALAVMSKAASVVTITLRDSRKADRQYQFPATGLPMAAFRGLVSDGNLGS
jgi:hypothetical protein